MKICPQCKNTYSDDSLNFCLEDGSVLSRLEETGAPPPTVMMSPARTEERNQQTAFQNSEVPTAPRHQMPVQKKSRAWIWVLGILAGVSVICGGGFIGLVALIPVDDESSDNTVVEENGSSEPSDGDSTRKLVKEDEIRKWEVIEDDFISSKKEADSLVLTSVTGYYYVILAKGFETRDASTLLRVRNTTGGKTGSGFGLVIHSSPNSVLEKDYAFVIRTDNGTYRIVQHTNKKERNLIEWTDSDAIRRGTSENVLEVRTEGDVMNFYINGKFVKKVMDYRNYKDGIAGIYTSDDVPVAFSKIELRK